MLPDAFLWPRTHFFVLLRLVGELFQGELGLSDDIGLLSKVWPVLWSPPNAACLQRCLSTLVARSLNRSTHRQRLESVKDCRGFSANFWRLLFMAPCSQLRCSIIPSPLGLPGL